jgi:hypothetical protein
MSIEGVRIVCRQMMQKPGVKLLIACLAVPVVWICFAGPLVTEWRLRADPFWKEMKPGVWVVYRRDNGSELGDLAYGKVASVTRFNSMVRVLIWNADVELPLGEQYAELEIALWDRPQILILGDERQAGADLLAQMEGPSSNMGLVSSDETIWESLDYYLSCLNQSEQDRFWRSVQSVGFQRTLSELALPAVLWGSGINAVGVRTPSGLVRWKDYNNEYEPHLIYAFESLVRSCRSPAPPESSVRVGGWNHLGCHQPPPKLSRVGWASCRRRFAHHRRTWPNDSSQVGRMVGNPASPSTFAKATVDRRLRRAFGKLPTLHAYTPN